MKKIFLKIKAWPWKRMAVFFALACLALMLLELALSACYPFETRNLDRYSESRRVFDSKNRLLRLTRTSHGEHLIKVKLSEVSPHLINAVIAGEDGRFFTHSGVDPLAIVRAGTTSLMRGKIVSGASTLTMQLARMADPHPRNLKWKIVEMFRARQLERLYSKDEILEMYLNLVPLGGTLRGVEASSQRWFGKPASDLTALESAMFVAMLPAPTRRSPSSTGPELLKWRNEILRRMFDKGYITSASYHRFRVEPLHAKLRQWDFLAPHYVDWKLRVHSETTLHETLELPLQKMVENTLRSRHNKPVDGEAVVVLNRQTGAVLAMLGSENYREKPFNASLSHRPAGSTLKPFLYALALEEGAMAINGRVNDHKGDFAGYKPRNFSNDFSGHMRASDALSSSRNLPAVRLLKDLGIKRFKKTLEELGLKVPAKGLGLDLSLGTLVVSPLQLAQAYQKFANPNDSFMSWQSRSAVLRALSKNSPAREQFPAEAIAWKTGTSSGRRDAWCVGISPEHIVVVWLGNLDGQGHSELVGSNLAKKILVSLFAQLLQN